MTETTYDVRVWKIQNRKNAKGKVTSYRVRWEVGGQDRSDSFKNKAQAESFRSDLVSAARKGEAFRVDTGLPVSMSRTVEEMSWFDFACAYVDMKWPEQSGNSRKGIAETLTTVTPALLATERGKPDDRTLRDALFGWAFNRDRRDTVEQPQRVRAALKWLASHTKPVSVLAEPAVLREVLGLIATRLDGKPSAASVVSRKRAVLHNALDYAVERGLLDCNRLPELKWSPPKNVQALDKRTVVNHQQALRLLEAVRSQGPSGPRLMAFFGVMYYAAARPGEAVNLHRQDVTLPSLVRNSQTGEWEEPPNGWGELLLSESAPETGARWSSTGRRRDRRQLKHRGKGDTRPVPCPPPLVRLLREHMWAFPPKPSGQLFYGLRGGELSQSTYGHAWERARKAALTPAEFASPLAKRPYDLRHAAVSTWLAAGVPPTQVAEWAGHSVNVLLQIYAKVLTGQEEASRRRIQEVLDE
ncbi:integrase [Actinopolyspora erythraea]|uniref:Integrase n=1 Tax=Actinopolyspora erythraea TaxID=414996 RepID=A0A099D7Q4_9ACTN|nr:tyrosine-type recombinase/integrase [Actinopolyspora erythraea]ASU78349.1 integrase [Actinopolyspora erythraea]KGI81961.1 integrase [Actinopolyspora erythraea]